MPREIKFRAWLANEKRMAFGYPDLNNQHFYESKDSKYPSLGTDFRVTEIMQYTGLKDKNGKEIYEGDIVKRKLQTEQPNGKWKNIIQIVPVVYEAPAFMYQVGKRAWMAIFSNEWKTMEVVGSIYENPELLI